MVIYRDSGEKARQVEPFTTYPPAGSTTPEDLWKVLQAYENEDRWPGAGDRAQRQPLQRLDVPMGRQPGQQSRR